MTIDYDDIQLAQEPDDAPDPSYLEQKDLGFEDRLEAFNRGDFGFVGVYARYELHNWQTGVTTTIRSAGLWGIESDSDANYFQQVFDEERQSLIDDLEAQGIEVANKPA
jgi:hypothetical protein